MTNSDYVRQLDNGQLASALMGSLINRYCTSPNSLECDHKWDEELNCSPCEACAYRWLKEERRSEH